MTDNTEDESLDNLVIHQLKEIEHYAYQLDDLRAKYDELIMAVGNKYPNETRHQTALRYIQQAERGTTLSLSPTKIRTLEPLR